MKKKKDFKGTEIKKKFDIIEYIKTCIKNYDDGFYSRTDLIDNLYEVLSKCSWQMHCDGKEAINNSIKGFDFVIEINMRSVVSNERY